MSESQVPAFEVRLMNFEGPFDLLLSLIAKHKLDITEVALSHVTGEFITYLRKFGDRLELTETSSFLLVGATLLDLKAARLLPRGEVEDDEDIELLEARDLLFARLLQYRAFKEIAAWMGEVLAHQDRWHPRPGGLERAFEAVLPELVIDFGPEHLRALAQPLVEPKASPVVSLSHLHTSQVSVGDQAQLLTKRLRTLKTATFRALCARADKVTTIARFLALLELFRAGSVAFEQLTPLGELTIRWSGDDDPVAIRSDFDDENR